MIYSPTFEGAKANNLLRGMGSQECKNSKVVESCDSKGVPRYDKIRRLERL